MHRVMPRVPFPCAVACLGGAYADSGMQTSAPDRVATQPGAGPATSAKERSPMKFTDAAHDAQGRQP